MPRRKKQKGTNSLTQAADKYEEKMMRYAPAFDPYGESIIIGMRVLWEQGYGPYYFLWETFRDSYGQRIPRGLRHLTVNCLFQMYKEYLKYGVNILDAIGDICKMRGLPDEVVNLIKEFIINTASSNNKQPQSHKIPKN